MILIDTNLLLYAYDANSPFHLRTRKHLESVLATKEPIGLAVLCVQAFLRVATNPSASPTPISIAQATKVIDTWIAMPHVSILYPGERHWSLLKQLAEKALAVGNLLTDAAIAAIALEYGAVIHTNDQDFARFAGVRWYNPLTNSSSR